MNNTKQNSDALLELPKLITIIALSKQQQKLQMIGPDNYLKNPGVHLASSASKSILVAMFTIHIPLADSIFFFYSTFRDVSKSKNERLKWVTLQYKYSTWPSKLMMLYLKHYICQQIRIYISNNRRRTSAVHLSENSAASHTFESETKFSFNLFDCH